MKKALVGLAVVVGAAVGGYYGHQKPDEPHQTDFIQCINSILADQGDSSGLSGLVSKVKQKYRLDYPTAEDLVYDTLLKVCTEDGVRNVRPYFQKSLQLNAFTGWQDRRRCEIHTFGPKDECLLIQQPDFRTAQCSELRRKIEAVFCQLPYDYQQLIQWHAFEQVDFVEIARRLKTTPKTARSRVDSAIMLLRFKMKM